MANTGLIIVAVAAIILALPHEDLQSYTYELNQPWRYQLLTADFDMPVKRDSVSAEKMRDSINTAFVPIVSRDAETASKSINAFRAGVGKKVGNANRAGHLTHLVTSMYARGIVTADLYKKIRTTTHGQLRVAGEENGSNTVQTIDAGEMVSPQVAFRMIDSIYKATAGPGAGEDMASVSELINSALVPNIVIDKSNNEKFLEQEYLGVNGATGVIKKGQRIVDRGEIITPQIYTNLNTYLEMAAANNMDDDKTTYFTVGKVLFLIVCFLALYLYLHKFRPGFLTKTKNMVFLITFITGFALFAILTVEMFGFGLYMVPFAMIPVVVTVFFDSRTAIFSLLVSVMVASLVSVFPFQFVFMELAAGLTAAFTLNGLDRRSQLFNTAIYTFITYMATYVILVLITEGTLSNFHWMVTVAFLINSVVLALSYFLIFVMEKIYGFTSSVTLVELSDINNPLLRRLAEDAPGTFQHSVQVSTLAAEAARAIGANTQLVRTGALYHDIGKLDGPIFFTENQHGVNPHTGLNPATSAQKIISHVTSGLSIAQHSKLPAVIRDFISQHHGKSVARYFYNTAVNNSPDGTVDRKKFTYPGPNPQSKETAILMMADAVEAASRSLPEYTPEAISNLVDKIIDGQEKDGLFNEAPISFRDIQTIKKTFKKRLSTIYHSRVSYPELRKNTDEK